MSKDGEPTVTPKELLVLVGGTCLGLASLKTDDPWIVAPMLTASAAAFVWLCIRHLRSWKTRIGSSLFIVVVFVTVGWRDLKNTKDLPPHLQAVDVLWVMPVEAGKSLTFIVTAKNTGTAGSLQFASGSVIADHLISEPNRKEVEAMFFAMKTQNLDNPIVMKPVIPFEAGEQESWSLTGGPLTDQQIQNVRKGAVQYLVGKGRYLGRPNLPPFELCFFWPKGFSSGAVKCESHNSR